MYRQYPATMPRSLPKFYLRVFSLGFGSRQMFPIRKERLSRISCFTTYVKDKSVRIKHLRK